MNIIITQVLAAATKASSGVSTPAWPWASGGAEKAISGPLPMAMWPQCSPFHATVVWYVAVRLTVAPPLSAEGGVLARQRRR